MKRLLNGFWIPILILALAVPAAYGSPQKAAEDGEVPEPDPAGTWLLQIVLLVGRTEGPSNLEDLPANTRKAVEDIQEFLPYKSYQLWDTSLIRSARHARGTLMNPNGTEFGYSVSFYSERIDGKNRLMFRSFEIFETAGSKMRKKASGDEVPSSPGPVITSSFAVDEGETIVVGTSKLNGGKEAMLVLLTAIP